MKKQVEVDIALSPYELATEFSNLCHDDQARFFNVLAIIVKGWSGGISMQLQYIADSPRLSDEARDVMRKIGDYAEKYNRGGKE